MGVHVVIKQKPVEVSASEEFRQAARLIELARSRLDLRQRVCGECGLSHYENIGHRKINRQTETLPTRLRNIADVLDGKKPQFIERNDNDSE